jgi:hypothetical protein
VEKRSVVINIVEASPLILFLIYYKFVEPASPQDWLPPFLMGAVIAVSTMFVLRIKGVSFNPVFVGINLYLLSGSLGLVIGLDWMDQLYGSLQSSGMLAWIIVAGVISLFFSPGGFIGIDSKNRQVVFIYSLYLLIIAIVTFLLAYFFRSSRVLSEIVPFTILFTGHAVLKSRANSKLGSGEVPK